MTAKVHSKGTRKEHAHICEIEGYISDSLIPGYILKDLAVLVTTLDPITAYRTDVIALSWW